MNQFRAVLSSFTKLKLLEDLGNLGRTEIRSEEHTSELQSRPHLVCRLLLEKKKFHGENRAVKELVDEATRFQDAGASLLDFRHSCHVPGAAIKCVVSIPVCVGLGGRPLFE